MSSESIKPIEEIRLGAVKAAIWKNMVDQGNSSRRIYNVSFHRLYRDGEGRWHSADSFGRDDLLVLAKVADQAHTRICGLQQAERAGSPA